MIETEFIIFAGGVRGGGLARRIKGAARGRQSRQRAAEIGDWTSFSRISMVIRVEPLDDGVVKGETHTEKIQRPEYGLPRGCVFLATDRTEYS